MRPNMNMMKQMQQRLAKIQEERRQIAEELGRTRVQVQSMLQRARAGLREELGERDD